MAVATPVLERSTDRYTEERETYAPMMTAEEIHNSRIKDNYARLINPDYDFKGIIGENYAPAQDMRSADACVGPQSDQSPVRARVEQQNFFNQAGIARPAQPYLVENARADAEIFRADSAINRQRATVAEAAPVNTESEEENEDLRPTSTTIQYKTAIEADRTNIRINADVKEHSLCKRDKIIIATFVSIVVALFALVIINSAIIAGLNADINAAQAGLDSAMDALSAVNSEIASVTDPSNVAEFALSHGLVLR